MQEIQIESILSKAKSLKSITEEPLAKKVLEIELDATSAKNQELLRRVIRSLDQYINKEENLMYVGFLGHYSSGKSTTINNLLNLNNSVHQRDTGLNPTDKAITLITDESNSNALILLNRESGNVPVRTLFIQNEVLKTLVIADTPGSGDPQIVNEMIQDFLPVCDHIIYFISAANPVDQADLPLLQQKTHKLPFIPIIFIVTRTDEFRVNKTGALASDNLDLPKKDQFLGQLISRIKETIATDKVQPTDFVFIDNEFQYGIEELKEILFSWSNTRDAENLARNHGYKVEYYRENLNSIYHFYLNIINERIQRSKDFVKAANVNIQRFDKSIEINNEKLRFLWNEGENDLKQTWFDEQKVLEESLTRNFATSLIQDQAIQIMRTTIFKGIEDLAKGHLGRTISDLNNHIKQKIREVKSNVNHNINEENFLEENISHLFPGRIDLTVSDQTMDIDFSKLNEFAKNYQYQVADLLNDTRSILKAKIANFKLQLSKKVLINKVALLYERGAKNINENFDRYFENVQMYRGSVLTRNTKEAIEKLRIGTQLDELDDEFSDEFISEKKLSAISQIYLPNQDQVNEFQDHILKQDAHLIELRKAVDSITTAQISLPIMSKECVDLSPVIEILTNHSESVLNKIYHTKINEVFDQHQSSFREYSFLISSRKKLRKKSIWSWTLWTGVIGLLIYLLFRYADIVKPPTLLADILLGLACAALCQVFGFLYGRFKNDLQKFSIQHQSDYVKQQRSMLSQMLNEDFWDDLSARSTEFQQSNNLSYLKSQFTSRIESLIATINGAQQSQLDLLKGEYDKLGTLVNSYKKMSSYFYNKHALIFQEVQKNTAKIEGITREIKETSIKPSFDLLNETTENLEAVKAKIIGIE